MLNPMPEWPAIINHAGDNELTYIESQAAWLADATVSAHPCDDEDILIDSLGYIFNMQYDAEHRQVNLQPGDRRMPLERFSEIVQMHLAVLEQCCISKLTFADYSHGIKLVASSEDQQRVL
jgi:hypothetical protein